MSFLLDMGISIHLIPELLSDGHGAAHVVDLSARPLFCALGLFVGFSIMTTTVTSVGHLRVARYCLGLAVLLGLVLAPIACRPGSSSHERAPTTVDQLASEGWEAVEARDYLDACEAFEEVLSRSGSDRLVTGSATLGLAYAKGEIGNHTEAIRLYESIEERFSDQQRALYDARRGLAQQYESVGDFASAEAVLIRNLEGAGEDAEPSGDANLMGNPYASYRHFAAFDLANFYYERQRYVLASAFLSAAQYTFPYQHFCGNAARTDELQVVLLRSRVLEKLDQREEAVQALMPHIFERESNLGLDCELAARAGVLIRSQLNSKEIEQLVDESLQSIHIIEGMKYPGYRVSIMGVELRFLPYPLTREEIAAGPEPESLRRYLLDTVFFRSLRGEEVQAASACALK